MSLLSDEQITILWIKTEGGIVEFAKDVESAAIEAYKAQQAVPDGFIVDWGNGLLVVTAPDQGQSVAYPDEAIYQLIAAMIAPIGVSCPSHESEQGGV